jgi:hypothetical protein
MSELRPVKGERNPGNNYAAIIAIIIIVWWVLRKQSMSGY